jgi:DNA-directed RNA polymerase sigma subunit (sigma70/sigma32)
MLATVTRRRSSSRPPSTDDAAAVVSEALSLLDHQDLALIWLLHLHEEPYTRVELGAHLGVSAMTIGNWEKAALARLRASIRAR